MTSSSGASMAPNGVCHFSRYWVAAVALVTLTSTTTLSLFARFWRPGVTRIVTSAAAAAAPDPASRPVASAAPMIVFQSMSSSRCLSKNRL